MEIETKDAVTWGSWLISFGGAVTWAKLKIGAHDREIKAIKEILTTDDNEPRYLSYKAHDIICGRRGADIAKIVEHQEKQDEKLDRILVAVTRLETRP